MFFLFLNNLTMYRKATVSLFLFFLLIFPTHLFAQNTHEVNLRISDTSIVGKNYPYATKVNLEINITDFQRPIFLYYFHNPVFSNMKIGLSYILEDENHKIVAWHSDWFSLLYNKPENKPKCMSTGFFINSKNKIIKKNVHGRKSNDYELAKFEINNPKQNVELYLMLGIFHKDLPKGEYYLYLVYSFNPTSMYMLKDIVSDTRNFKGNAISNKVKLIIE